MIHPNTELRFIGPEVGYGVFATALIPKGTITYVKDGLEIEVSPAQYEGMAAPLQASVEKYSYIDERGYRIISWDFAKYVNHCCQCNTMSTGYGFEMALRDILPGEQLTDEYGIFNLTEEIPLHCSQVGCRKAVKPQDFDLYYPLWDEKIQAAIPELFNVAQPLWDFVESETITELGNFKAGFTPYKSVYALRNLADRHIATGNNGVHY